MGNQQSGLNREKLEELTKRTNCKLWRKDNNYYQSWLRDGIFSVWKAWKIPKKNPKIPKSRGTGSGFVTPEKIPRKSRKIPEAFDKVGNFFRTSLSKFLVKLSENHTVWNISNISVTEEEIQKWYDDFSSDCPTGKLQKTEFTKIYKQLFPNGNPTAFAW